MKEEVLVELGLSKNESKIYVSLLEQGSSTVTQVAGLSGIHRVNVYDSLKKLKMKGLIGEISHDGKKLYQAAPPEALRNIIKEKEIRLEQVIPQLTLSNGLSRGVHNVQIYEGYDFIRNLFLHFLELKEDILDLNVLKFVLQQMGQHFQEVIHIRRAQQKQKMYHIYHKEAIERIKFLNTLPYTFARYLEQDYDHNVTTTICGDEVAIQVYYQNNEQKPLTIMIKNKQIADAYRAHFFILWEKAKMPKQT